MLDATSVEAGATGANVECVQKALTAAGFYNGPVDGTFSPALTAAATEFQQATGLYVDGVVGRRTAALLGIWPGDDSFVIHTPPPAPGATDSIGSSSPRSRRPARTPRRCRPIPGKALASGSCTAAPDSESGQSTTTNTSCARTSSPAAGSTTRCPASTRSTARARGPPLGTVRPICTTWCAGSTRATGAIGFHQIPVHKSDGSVYQTEAELGQRMSGGCQRQAALDAQFMWDFAEIGTPVYVV